MKRNTEWPPVAVGVTGGPGCGKSTVAKVLIRMGVAVLDADDLAREVTAPGSPGLAGIVRRFGPESLAPDGSLDRAALAERVFADDASRKALEAIVHPLVRKRMQAWRDGRRAAGQPCAGVIPLLFETGGEMAWDCTLCIAASDAVSLARLRERAWSDEMIERRRAAQWPLAEKIRRADHVIWNEGTLAELETAVNKVWNEILEKESRHGR